MIRSTKWVYGISLISLSVGLIGLSIVCVTEWNFGVADSPESPNTSVGLE
jgi:hypothetical protein